MAMEGLRDPSRERVTDRPSDRATVTEGENCLSDCLWAPQDPPSSLVLTWRSRYVVPPARSGSLAPTGALLL